MKKTTLLLAICFAFQFNAMSQVLIPDNVFEQRLLDDGIDTDGLLNGQISNADALAATGTLYLGYIGLGSISDFTGIEAFVNIDALIAEYNFTATNLDVSTITGLTFLQIEGCELLTDVNTTGLTSLVEIRASGAALTSLDVTTNTALEILSLRNNDIPVLDLSNNVALVFMDAKANGLTYLDMRNGNNANITYFNADVNPDLNCIFVDDSSAGYYISLPWITSGSNYVNDQAACNLLTVDTETQNVFNMFPNPANNSVFVNVNTQNSQIFIYDITGKLVLSKSLSLGQNSVDISKLSSGVYLARFVAEGNIETKKLIVQ